MKKVILITGTSTGLGLKTAVLLASKGHTVYATLRNLSKKEQLEKEAATAGCVLHISALDVCDPASVQKCVEEIIAKESRLDVLINNAGAGFLRASELATEEEIKNIMDVNYFGVVRTTNAVLPQMRKQKSGHIINIGSVGGLVAQPFNELYCAAKFALEGYTEGLATYCTPAFGIHFTIVEPGGISTEFAGTVLKDLSAKARAISEYDAVFARYIGSLQNRSDEERAKIYQTPEQVAEIINVCMDAENPPLRIRTSEWANDFCDLKTKGDPDGLTLHNKLSKAYFVN